MAKNNSGSTEDTSNNNMISINRNLFLSLFGACILLIGIGLGFAWGQHTATRNITVIQESLQSALQTTQPGSAVVIEPQSTSQPDEQPEMIVTSIVSETQQAAPQKVAVSVDDDPYLGAEDAPVTIVAFSDFQCSYCARFHEQTFDTLLETYGDQVRFVYRDFPLSSIHPEAQNAAETAQCANEQDSYWQMVDLLFSNQSDLSNDSYQAFAEELQLNMDDFTQCLESGKYEAEVTADLEDGLSYGVTGTPAFFVNGTLLMGALPFDQFADVIEQELKDLE